MKIYLCPNCLETYEHKTRACGRCDGPVFEFNLDVPLVEQDSIQVNYRGAIRSMVRGLWTGVIDIDQAFDAGDVAIRNSLTRAWNAGMQSVGVMPSEQSPEERIEIAQIINNEVSRLFSFLLDIEDNDKASGAKLAPHMNRAEMWISRVADVESRARVAARTDPKLKWVLGPTEHCKSCVRVAGKVKRASSWKKAGIHPRNPPNSMLDCGGYRCQCDLVPTTEPLSRGPLPKLP